MLFLDRRPRKSKFIAITQAWYFFLCSINKKVVATFPRTEVVAPGRLKSTDGTYDLRFAHRFENRVTPALLRCFCKSPQ